MVDDLNSGCGLEEAASIVEIDAMDLDLVGPGHLFELVRRSHGNANVVAGLQKARDESPPDITGGPEHKNGSREGRGVNGFGLRLRHSVTIGNIR
ncbi:hypothetical protein GCM10009689_10020 [Brevibacterium antiquum]